jgi:hypothetical protein
MCLPVSRHGPTRTRLQAFRSNSFGAFFDSREQLRERHAECRRDQHQVVETQVSFTSFDRAHPCSMKTGSIGKRLLRVPFFLSQTPNALAHGPQNLVHLPESVFLMYIRLQY